MLILGCNMGWKIKTHTILVMSQGSTLRKARSKQKYRCLSCEKAHCFRCVFFHVKPMLDFLI